MVLSLLPISPPIGKESQSKLETIESQRDGRNQNTNSSFLLGVVFLTAVTTDCRATGLHYWKREER